MTSKHSTNMLNACIKSLFNLVDNTVFQTTKQDYVELSYSGPISNLHITINNPKQLGKNVPVIGYINGSIPVYLGTTNGIDLDIRAPSVTTPPQVDKEVVNLGYTWKQYDDQNNPSEITEVESDTTSETEIQGGITRTDRTRIVKSYTYTGEHKEEEYQHGEKYHHYYHYLIQRTTTITTTYTTGDDNNITVLQRI